MGKIKARFIFEMLGKPPEFLKENLENHVKSLENENVKILSKKIHEPKLLKNEKSEANSLYTSFAEVELEIDNLNLVFAIVIRMLPSHIEIVEPSELDLKNFDLSAILSDLAIKIHKYDEVAKVLMMERDGFAMQLNKIRNSMVKNMKVEEVGNTIKKEDIKIETNEKKSKKDKKKN
jgi:hypothetical protein